MPPITVRTVEDTPQDEQALLEAIEQAALDADTAAASAASDAARAEAAAAVIDGGPPLADGAAGTTQAVTNEVTAALAKSVISNPQPGATYALVVVRRNDVANTRDQLAVYRKSTPGATTGTLVAQYVADNAAEPLVPTWITLTTQGGEPEGTVELLWDWSQITDQATYTGQWQLTLAPVTSRTAGSVGEEVEALGTRLDTLEASNLDARVTALEDSTSSALQSGAAGSTQAVTDEVTAALGAAVIAGRDRGATYTLVVVRRNQGANTRDQLDVYRKSVPSAVAGTLVARYLVDNAAEPTEPTWITLDPQGGATETVELLWDWSQITDGASYQSQWNLNLNALDSRDQVDISGQVGELADRVTALEQAAEAGGAGSAVPSTLALRPGLALGIHAYGQSNSIGSDSTVVLSRIPGRDVLMPTGGLVFSSRNDATANWAARRDASDWVPARETAESSGTTEYGETGWYAAAAHLAARIAAAGTAESDRPALYVSTSGWGGLSIAALAQGTPPYTDLIAAVQAAYDHATALGYVYEVLCVPYDQGEADQAAGTTRASYAAALTQLQSDLDADIKAITGQTADVVLVCCQKSKLLGGASDPDVSLACTDAHASAGPILCVGPDQDFVMAAGENVHYDAWTARLLHARMVEAAYQLRLSALAAYDPPRLLSAAWVNQAEGTVELQFSAAVRLDASVGADPGVVLVHSTGQAEGPALTVATTTTVIADFAQNATGVSDPEIRIALQREFTADGEQAGYSQIRAASPILAGLRAQDGTPLDLSPWAAAAAVAVSSVTAL